ncbi:helix-turn-helix domain-containing protein [Xanthomonas oryzae]|uniref:Sea27 n=1 Tax=Xanthomonas oryzae pv. oryzicola (strain BLS256) TaxID=383407 RepID=G7TCM3_XANOB|nr:helix-turn-helix domain-containing protein [Xanthomonas oryzae]AEQ96201.1 Sea27 [Xanthomonas oryzae pv. oryzicola BLS256]PUE97235.1 helix-turn-helix domain-containing protein [Xanthomonas oryzae pv. oryzicola]WVN05172.1 helix-turn-helix domain-containing protein [Xanthomonas oryzae pv. oryzicola]
MAVKQEGIMMSEREVERLTFIRRVLAKELTQKLAAQQLGLTVRQIRRLCRGVRTHGAQALVSKRRGVPSNRRIGDERKNAIMALIHECYGDFGPQLAGEYLQSQHQQRIGTETLRGWMIEAGLWKAKKRCAARQHSPRARRAGLGELVQIDGSHHDWFEGRGDKCCLIAFIDDATGRVLAARFSPAETTQAYLALLQAHVSTHGAPLTNQQRKLLKLKTEIALQDSMRDHGIHHPDTHISPPPLGQARYGLRPTQSCPSGR